MKEQGTGGSIVLIASVAAHCATPGKSISGYCATKGAVLALTRALADELIPYNIRVNSISPGYYKPIAFYTLLSLTRDNSFILTDMTIQNIGARPNIIQEIESHIPSGKIGDRRDLKGAVVLLLSDASAYTTGSDLLIDGGLVAH